jgi:hypothetical protein
MPRTVTRSPRIDRDIAKLDKGAKKAAREAGKKGDLTRQNLERAQLEALRGKKQPKA